MTELFSRRASRLHLAVLVGPSDAAANPIAITV